MTENDRTETEIVQNMVGILQNSWLPIMEEAILKLTGLPGDFFSEVVEDWHKYPNPDGLPSNLKGMYQLIGGIACARRAIELTSDVCIINNDTNGYNNAVRSLNNLFKVLCPLLAEMFRHENVAIPKMITQAKEEAKANAWKARTEKTNKTIACKTQKRRDVIVAFYNSLKEKDPSMTKEQAAMEIAKMKGIDVGWRTVQRYIPKG